MHLGKNNVKQAYAMPSSELADTTQERDAGVSVDSWMQFSAQTTAADKQANEILSSITKAVENNHKGVI